MIADATFQTKTGVRLRVRAARNEDAPSIRAFVIDRLRAEKIEPDLKGIDPDISSIETKYSGKSGFYDLLESETGHLVGTVSVIRVNEAVCELRKMYLAEQVRGQGMGKNLLDRSL